MSVDPHDLFLQAMRFYKADLRLRRDDISSEEMSWMIFPAMTLNAFSSELFLKCLLAMEGHENVRGHNLLALFEKLKFSSQKMISANWDDAVVADADMFEALGKMSGRPPPVDISGALAACGDLITPMVPPLVSPGHLR